MSFGHSTVCMSSVYVPATWRFMRAILLVLSIGSAHCSNSTASGPDAAAPPDGAVSPGDGPDAAAAPTVAGTFSVFDAMSRANIPGATAAYGNLKKPTDNSGAVTFDLPLQLPYEVIVTAMNYPPIHFYGITESDIAFSSSRALFTDAQLNQLAAALGTTYDPTKAIIGVNGAGADFKSLPQSMTVDTSVAYGIALVPDKSSPVGFKKSNATVAGDVSQVLLINVTPGAVPLMVTPPPGTRCTVYPSSRPQGTEAVVGYAHEISTISLICQ